MLNFISFGSGSSGNCYLLFTENEKIIIDAGMGLRTLKKHLLDYGLSLDGTDAILITHDHADHVKSIGKLSSELFVPVYGTRLVHHGIIQNFCVRQKIPAGSERFIEKDKEFCIGDFRITPFGVPHDSLDNVGYCIRYNDITFCLMTDIGHITDDICRYINEANYLVIEANYERERLIAGPYPKYLKERIMSGQGHLSNEECGKALLENASINLRHVWLAHLSAENNHPELARKTVETILRSHGIIAGKDFNLDILNRNKPTGIFELK